MAQCTALFTFDKTKAEWKRELLNIEAEAIEEQFSRYDDSTVLCSYEVFDAIVTYLGGLAGGSEARRLVRRIYGVDLS